MPHPSPRDRWRWAALVVGLAYALGAATTTPFTWAANVVTGVPIVVLAVLAFVRWPARPEPLVLPAPQRARHPYRPWVVLVVVVVAWELAEYLARGSRGAHPTLSSMADALDRHYLGTAVLFFLWLCLGALIMDCGSATVTPKEAASR